MRMEIRAAGALDSELIVVLKGVRFLAVVRREVDVVAVTTKPGKVC